MPKRPFPVTLLAISVLCLTIWNAVRFGTALARWDFLIEFSSPPGPWYIALTGLFWSLAWATIFPGLWLGWGQSRQAAGPAGVVYVLYYWVDRLTLQSAVPDPNWPCMAAVNLAWLALIASALCLPASRSFFRKRDQR